MQLDSLIAATLDHYDQFQVTPRSGMDHVITVRNDAGGVELSLDVSLGQLIQLRGAVQAVLAEQFDGSVTS